MLPAEFNKNLHRNIHINIFYGSCFHTLKDKQCTYDVTMRHVLATIVAEARQ
jgi:hypothetical protein